MLTCLKCGTEKTHFTSSRVLGCAKDACNAAVAARAARQCCLFQVSYGQPNNTCQQADETTAETAVSSAKACNSSKQLNLQARVSGPDTLVGVTWESVITLCQLLAP